MKRMQLLHACAILALSTTLHAQTALDVWHEDGQTWLKWTNDRTFTGAETWSIYRSAAPITDLAQARWIARSYPHDAQGANGSASQRRAPTRRTESP